MTTTDSINTQRARVFMPDKTPLAMSGPFGALYGDNPQGLDPAFLSNPTTYINNAATFCNTCGIKRLMPHMYQGANFGYYYSAATYWAFAESVRTMLLDGATLSSLLGTKRLEWFTGSIVPNTYSQTDQTADPIDRVTTEGKDTQFLFDAYAPLARLGITRFWLDFSSDDSFPWTELEQRFYDNLGWVPTLGGEPAPGYTDDLAHVQLDPDRIAERPWLMLEWSYKSYLDPDEQWEVPADSEVHLVVLDSATRNPSAPIISFEYLDRLKAAGFVVSAAVGAGSVVTDWVKSRYSPGSTPFGGNP